VIIDISENRIHLWRVVGQKGYWDYGQEQGVGYLDDFQLNFGRL
jgi:hypothetical protein